MNNKLLLFIIAFIIGCTASYYYGGKDQADRCNKRKNKTVYTDKHDWPDGCVNPRDYQIELYMDTMWIYDGERLVDSIIDPTFSTKLDTILINDNL